MEKAVNILGIDCSSENLSLAIVSAGKTLVNYNRRMSFGASELIVVLEKFLRQLKLSIKDFSTIVIGAGPGSFTGLRISFSVVKAFSLSASVPIIAVSSFTSLAQATKNKNNKITVIIDARKNLLYRGDFNISQGAVKAGTKLKLVSFEDMAVKTDSLFVTYDTHIRNELFKRYPGILLYPKNIYPKAINLIEYAQDLIKNKKYTPLKKLEPLYIHPKTCQVRTKQ